MLTQLRSSIFIFNAIAIFCLIGLFPIIGGRVTDSLIILLILNIALSKNSIENIRHNFTVCALLIQYPIINLINVNLNEINEFSITYAPANYRIWTWSCAAIILLGAFFSPKISGKFIKYGIPTSIVITFSILLYLWLPNNGRIEPFGHPVFYAPLFGTSLALLFIFRNEGAIRGPDLSAIALISLTIIIALLFSQTRGIFIAQILVLLIVILIMTLIGYRKWALTMAASGVACILIVVSTLSWTGNSNLTRLTSALNAAQYLMTGHESAPMPGAQTPSDTITLDGTGGPYVLRETNTSEMTAFFSNSVSSRLENVSEKIELSGGLRLKFWSMAIKKIIDRPLFGYGANHEPKFLSELGFSFTHVHNIYLSWMLWGGTITLISGLVFICAAPLGAILTGTSLSHKLSTASLSVLWLSSMAFDSFIVYEAFNYIFITLSILSFASQRQA